MKGNKVSKVIKKVSIFLLMATLTIILFIGVMIVFSLIQEKFLVEDGFDIWLTVEPYQYIIFILEGLLIWVAVCIASKINGGPQSEDVKFYHSIFKLIKKHKYIFISIISIMIYLIIINIVYIKGDRIVVYSTFSPFGREYTFKDIEEIEVGFGEKSFFSLVESEGVFYYDVKLKDGTKFDLNNVGGEGSRYKCDTYLPVETIDINIMKAMPNVTKKTSLDNIEHAYLDQRYIDRFKRIIDNVKS